MLMKLLQEWTRIGRHLVDLLTVDLDLLLQVKLEIDPKYCVFGLAKFRRRRIIPTMCLDAYCKDQCG